MPGGIRRMRARNCSAAITSLTAGSRRLDGAMSLSPKRNVSDGFPGCMQEGCLWRRQPQQGAAQLGWRERACGGLQRERQGRAVPFWRYRALPDAGDGDFQNQFVGDYVLYGAGNVITAVPWQGGDLTQVALDHRTDRIEVMGREAIVIGASGDSLVFTGIQLGGGGPRAAARLTIPNAAQSELRSHGFFYREDGVIGLPIRKGSVGVFFVRNNYERFTQLGVLAAGASRSMDDACRASCVDWYGNARPLFVADRVFALLGYELVEGSISASAIEEVRRVSFAPRGTTVAKD
jgi:hypothetical protein